MFKIGFSKIEIQHILVASLVLGFIFAFKEWGVASPDALAGLENWLRYFVMAIVALVIHTFGHKVIAAKNYAQSEFRLWFLQVRKKSIPTGILFPVLFSFISNGSWGVPLVETNIVRGIPALRAKKKFKYLTEFETAIIALAGPVLSVLIALIFKAMALPGFEKFIVINYMIGLVALIPFSTLDGAKIFAGSKYLYLGAVIFLVTTVLLMQATSLITTIIFAIILAIILTLITLYKTI